METYGYDGPDQSTRADAEVTLHDGLESAEPRAPFERGESLGRYVVLDTLGAGGMGIVLAAYDTTLDRRVALKLLHARASKDPENHARLLREAQALAKLSHPRVVSVYDVGELRGHVFISMEFIDGPNLREWLRAEERTAAQILSVFRGAGKGLRAAHDAGIVHRDFKPDNILIGPGGKAYVTDFGLALEANVPPETLDAPTATRSASSRLTETGAIMGTPAYMPIEQHAGLSTDHRSDQFSFCVSLFEALHGVRPFSGTNANELCLSIGRANLPASPSAVSRKVRRALVRGLSPKSEDRFPSMRALLRALTPPTRSSRTWIFGGVGGLAVGGTLVALSDPSQPPCASVGDRVSDVYGPAQRRALQAAFTQTELPYAQTSFDSTAQALDAFAARWATSAESACLASDRGEQSGEMLDLRMLCLDRGLLSLSATLEILSAVEADEVRESAKIASGLPDLALCEDLDALPKLAILPASPEQAAEIDTLLPVVERVRAYVLADQFDEAEALLKAHGAELEGSTYPLIQTLHRTWEGRLLFDRRDKRAAEILEQAHLLALEHGLDTQASRTAVVLSTWYAGENDLDAALRWVESAAALARASGSNRLQATAAATTKTVYARAGRHDEAVAQTRLALDLTENDASYPPRARVELLLSHAEALQTRDQGDAGDAQVQEARALIGQLDDDAPVIANIETDLGQRAAHRGDYATARRHSKEALRIVELHYGRRSLRYGAMLINAAIPLQELGITDDALADLTEAYDIFTTTADYPIGTGQVLVNMSNLLWNARRLPQLRQRLDQLDSLVQEHNFENTEIHSLSLLLRARLEQSEGQLEAARAHATQSQKIIGKLFDEMHTRSVDVRTILARVELEAGNHATARRLIERSREADIAIPADRALTSFVLARVLWEADGASDADRERAVELARSALADYENAPAHGHDRSEVQAWLEAHPGESAPAP